MLDFFWDLRGGVLLVAPLGDVPLDLVQLEAHRRGSAPVLLGCGSLMAGPGFLVVRLPEIPDGEDLRLLVQAFPPVSEDATAHPPHAQSLVLANVSPPERAEAMLWTVIETVDGLFLWPFPPDEPAPDRMVSSLWTSRMQGITLYPATRGGEANARPLVRITARARRDDADRIIHPPVFDFDFECQPSGPLLHETTLTLRTLSANQDVMPLLVNRRGHVVQRRNEVSLRLAQDRPATATVPQPMPATDVPSVWSDTDDSEPPATDRVDYLDRILIEAPIPVDYQLRVEDGPTTPLEAHGSCALIYLGDGRLVEDTGGLVDRLTRGSEDRSWLDTFLQAMERHDDRIAATDCEAASEILVLAMTLISRFIRSTYDAASVRLLPHDTHDFLAAPSYFGLIAASPRVARIGRFIQELSRGGRDQSEAEKAGRFALEGLFSEKEAAVDSSDQRRLRLFATHKIHDGLGWDVVPLTLRADIRAAVAAGVAWDGPAIGELIDFLSLRRNEPALAELAEINDLLTGLGALPLELDAQIITAPFIDDQLHALAKMQAGLRQVIGRAESSLDLGTGADVSATANAEGKDDAAVLRRVLTETAAPRHGFPAQAYDFFVRRVAQIGKTEITGALWIVMPDIDAVSERLASHFLHRVAADCDIIDGFVRNGYRNPLEPEHAPGLHFAEAGTMTFRHPLAQAEQDWLYGEERHPQIVEHWRQVIRSDYESQNRPSRSDRS